MHIVPNIHEYRRIKHLYEVEELEGRLQAQHIDRRAPFGYYNVTALDCHDNLEDHVTDNWDSGEMELVDLFYPGVHYNGHTVHYTFVANLLARFFNNVISLNLSVTIWSNHALHSIPWIMLQKLIWNKCLFFDLLLPHLGVAENLEEL